MVCVISSIPRTYNAQVPTKSKNVFDNLASLNAPTCAELRDEYDRYLSTDPEVVDDILLWWSERHAMYPRLSHMALDYLTIPGKYN